MTQRDDSDSAKAAALLRLLSELEARMAREVEECRRALHKAQGLHHPWNIIERTRIYR